MLAVTPPTEAQDGLHIEPNLNQYSFSEERISSYLHNLQNAQDACSSGWRSSWCCFDFP